MAKRGRPKKSMEDKLLEGNPGNRPIEPDLPETDPTSGRLQTPKQLCKDGRQAFTELMDAFPDWYFTKADRHLIVAYCEVIARKRKAQRHMKNQELVLTRGTGARCINPLLTIIQQAELRLQALSDQLGISREKRIGIAKLDPDRVPEMITEEDGSAADEFGDLVARPIFGQTSRGPMGRSRG